MTCRVCHNSAGNKVHTTREMMFGFGDYFDYIECGACGCLQILEMPQDLARYYPAAYYSFGQMVPENDSLLKLFLKQQRARYALHGRNFIGWVATLLWGMPPWYEWLGGRNVDFDSSILDVGCGTGVFLRSIRKDGFSNLTGIDPFIDADIEYPDGVIIKKQDLDDMAGLFDFIMLHHSFEHMYDSRSALRHLYRLIKPGHYVLIRIPIASSEAWEIYGVDWVDLDPPRHLIVHTRKSMELLAHEIGFELHDVVYDSNTLQFWGSEQYKKGIPLMDPRSYRNDRTKSIFSPEDMAAFAVRAKALNAEGRGDQACFYLYKPTSAQ